MNKVIILKLALIFFLVSCAKPKVVQIKQPNDKNLNCIEIENAIIEAEKFKMDAKYEKDNTGGNIARVLLFWPALATTFHNADKAIRASNDRIFHLENLSRQKKCNFSKKDRIEINNSGIASELKILKNLYRSGDITKEEYEKAKKKIIK